LKLQPLDWMFSDCPPDELPILYCYEFSRESISLRETVDYMRHGQPEESTYWTPDQNFGWREWPLYPFLSIPQPERTRRIAQPFAPNPVADIVQATAKPPFGGSIIEQQLAIAKHVREQCTAVHKTPPKGRRANALDDQLRALSIHRLRQHHSARKVIDLLQEHFLKVAYKDPSNLDRAKAKLPKHLAAFVLRAQGQIQNGRWFPPFGPYVIKP
jgi:hypothetical protein